MSDNLKNITVQDLIDRLTLIEDKTQQLEFVVYHSDGFSLEAEKITINELRERKTGLLSTEISIEGLEHE